jgi:hypothetical protein
LLGYHGLTHFSLRLVDYDGAWSAFGLLMLNLLFDVLGIGFLIYLLLVSMSISHQVLRCGGGSGVRRVCGSARFILDVLFLKE